MSTAQEIQTQIALARAELEASREDRELAMREANDANNRQCLRRELDTLREEIEDEEKGAQLARSYAEDVDNDRDGNHLPEDAARNPRAKKKKRVMMPAVDQDIANCRYNVSKGGHEWKIEGISWLQSTLQQNSKGMTTSTAFAVGEAPFVIDYHPEGGEISAFRHQRGTLALRYLGVGNDITMRYRFLVQKQGKEFVAWGDELEVCQQKEGALGLHGYAFGPDVISSACNQNPSGVFGLTHEKLLKSEYVHDDTFTVKVTIQMRSAEMWERCKTTKVQVEVPAPTLHSNLQALLDDGRLSDVTFVVEGERFKAHRTILAARSEVLDCQLRGGMRDSEENEIIVEQCDPATFKALLLFLYTDSFEPIEELIRETKAESEFHETSTQEAGGGSSSAVVPSSSSSAVVPISSAASSFASKRASVLQNVLAVAHKYQLERLRLWGEQQLCECINEERVCALLCQAHIYGATQLERVCLEFVKNRHATLVVTPQFGNLTSEWPEVMLKVNVVLAGVEPDKASAAFEAQQQSGDRGGEGNAKKRKRSEVLASGAE
jgi:hypothetical protein